MNFVVVKCFGQTFLGTGSDQSIPFKYGRPKNISEDMHEMPQQKSTTFPRHQKKERWGTNKDKTYIKTLTHKELQQKNQLEMNSRKTTERRLTSFTQTVCFAIYAL